MKQHNLLKPFIIKFIGLIIITIIYNLLYNPVQAQTSRKKRADIQGNSLRNMVPDQWYKTSSAMLRVTLKGGIRVKQLSKDSTVLNSQLDTIVKQGYSSIGIYATPYGGNSFNGLDVIDHYNIDSEYGTMDDFRRVVRQAHRKKLAVVSIDNLGYCSIDAPHFLKACNDIRSGKASKETNWFCWADSINAQHPMEPDQYYLGGGKYEKWVYSSLAGKYYWTKWEGLDKDSVTCSLPQYNWSPEWQQEVKGIVRFWMNTGIDGMLLDAVTWYTNYNWQIGKECITDIISSYGNTLILPEGAGGFHEYPVPWVTDGGWNCVIDYGLGIWWEMKKNPLFNAIIDQDPSGLETALQNYHDHVVADGGILFIDDVGADIRLKETEQYYLYVAFVIATGHLYSKEMHSNEKFISGMETDNWNTNFENMYRNDGFVVDKKLANILWLKNNHPAFGQLSKRQKLNTNNDSKYHSFIQKAPENSERILCVFNFQATEQQVTIDMSGVNAKFFLDLDNSQTLKYIKQFQIKLPAFGYRFYKIIQ